MTAIEKQARSIATMHGLQEDEDEILASIAIAELRRQQAERERQIEDYFLADMPASEVL